MVSLVDLGTAEKKQEAFEGFMAQTHWVARALYAEITNRDPFYREDLDQQKMRTANGIANALYTLRNMGPDFGPMADTIQYVFGVAEETSATGELNYYFDDDSMTRMLLKYGPNSFERALREGGVVRDRFGQALITKDGIEAGTHPIKQQVPFIWRLIQGTTGIKLKQETDSVYLRSRLDDDIRKAILDKSESIGLTKSGKIK